MVHLMDVGTPKYAYQIGYADREWHLVLTSKNRHFYFNSQLCKSYWQIQDIEEIDDKDEFAKCIDYDYIGVLTAKLNGLKGLDNSYYFKSTEKSDENEKEEEASFEDNVDAIEDEENSEKDDSETNEQLVKEFLEDEGYIVPEEDVLKMEEAPSGVLQLGYSSSEEEDEESISKDKLITENKSLAENTSLEDADSANNSDSDTKNPNEGLDLALSEDEDNGALDFDLGEEGTLKSTKEEFKRLLDDYKDRISVYDPWFLVEEELAKEFAQRSEYYSIPDGAEKERIFDEWVALQQENSEMKPHEEEKTGEITQIVEGPYPSDIQLFYQFLQLYKSDIKKLFYKEFLAFKGLEMEDYLAEKSINEGVFRSPKTREQHYRIFKITLDDFSAYERGVKKAQSVPSGVNLKKKKIDEYLALQTVAKPLNSEAILRIRSSEEDYFTKWTRVCNEAEVSTSVAESPVNYIVGDEKRFEAYCEWAER